MALHIAREVKTLTDYIEYCLMEYNNPFYDFFDFSITKDEYLSFLEEIGECKSLAFFDVVKVRGELINFDSLDSIENARVGYGETYYIVRLIDKVEHKIKNTYVAETHIIDPVIDLNLVKVCGDPYNRRYEEIIQHEVAHFYKAIKRYHKRVKNIDTRNYRELSRLREIACKNCYNENLTIRFIAEMYYFLNREEQSAFANGLYKRLVIENPMDVYACIADTREFKYLKGFKRVLQDIDRYIEDEDWFEAKKLFYGETVSSAHAKKMIKTFLRREVPKFQKKISGVITKYLEEEIMRGYHKREYRFRY